MTKFHPGQRVHIEYETRVSTQHTPRVEASQRVFVDAPTSGAYSTAVPLSAVTRPPEVLPTTLGSIIHITNWYGPTDWNALLTAAGWHIDADEDVYPIADFTAIANSSDVEWTLVQEAGAETPND